MEIISNDEMNAVTKMDGKEVNKQNALYKRIRSGVDKIFGTVVGLAIILELIVMFTNVVARVFFNTSIFWSQEVGQLALIVIAFVGGALAYPRGEHIAVQIVIKRIPIHWRLAFEAAVNWLIFIISMSTAVLAIKAALSYLHVKTMILHISQAWFTLPMVVGLLLFAFYGIHQLCSYPRRMILTTGAVLAGLILLIWATESVSITYINSNTILVLTLVLFFLLLFIGLPIGFVLSVSSLLYLLISGKVSLIAVPRAMEHAVSNFILLAIPFFVMTGYLMTEGGLSRRLIDFVMSFMGRIRGGLLHVIIVVTYIVSGISGSKVADVVAVGSTMNTALRKEGYKPGEGAAVLAAAAIMGETVPPSIAMLVLGSITTLSIGTLFVAGLLPAIVMAICLMILISIRARTTNMPTGVRVSLKESGRRALIAIPALLAPVILIGGIMTGIGTPTEVSSTAVIYSLLLGMVVYRGINVRDLWGIILETAAKSGMVLFIVSTASGFSWSLTVAKVPQQFAMLLTSLGGSTIVFLLTTIVLLIIMGAMLEGLPAILIFGPLLVPIAPQFGVNPIQFGMVLIIAMGFGTFLPPIGVGSYVCTSVMKTTLEDMMKHMLPYLIFLFIGLLLIAFIPWFSLVLPQLFNLSIK